MKIRIFSLGIQFKEEYETIEFAHFTYFYGQMGAGKSSIARLIDFCFGGDLDLSPALQSEFLSAKLNLSINDLPVSLERNRESPQIIAQWGNGENAHTVIVPARHAAGEVIPQTGVENLSDLLFFVAQIRPPKVRRSKSRDDSDLERLSVRNLLWFCYLDQDSMDSSFFNLDFDAPFYNRNKSKDVLRYIIGFHQEEVAQLETDLQEVRERRLKLQSGAESLKTALEDVSISEQSDIELQIEELKQELAQVDDHITQARQGLQASIPHRVETLRSRARSLSWELDALEDAISTVEDTISGDNRHNNELQMLKVKFRRASTAKHILAGVDFTNCPSCSQSLPSRNQGICVVCGQPEPNNTLDNSDAEIIEKDAASRINELEDAIKRRSAQLINLKRRQQEFVYEKQKVDQEISEAMSTYDSIYLSTALSAERRKAEIRQTLEKLSDYLRLSGKVNEFQERAAVLETQEQEFRAQLKSKRAAAEKDMSNLAALEELFHDCLIRVQLPAIQANDEVVIKPPHFLPEVISPDIGDLAVTSFSNLSSGGKKSLFKACFAIALHRLAVSIDAVLPTLLIIDSPMKNISERENRIQFEGFHRMLYELAESELSGTQFILIDKEFLPPNQESNLDFKVRHMIPDGKDNPPLIPYYRRH